MLTDCYVTGTKFPAGEVVITVFTGPLERTISPRPNTDMYVGNVPFMYLLEEERQVNFHLCLTYKIFDRFVYIENITCARRIFFHNYIEADLLF